MILVRGLVALAVLVPASAGVVVTTPGTAAARSRVTVVAAENFWGSIAKQLAGTHASVVSIISNPDTDPHDYEPRVSDGRAIASADYVIENGIGYDTWAQKLLDASPSSGRKVLDVGKLIGVGSDGNPHQWYSPDTVERVINRITRDLKSLDPKNAGYYDARNQQYVSKSLARYHALITEIRQKYAGTPVGASESIFSPLARSLGLDLITPTSFLNAVAEGTDPTAQDKATVDHQINTNAIKVFVYNRQNATPDVKALINEARTRDIPVTTVTETLTPASTTFQAWQSKQLAALDAALAVAAGR
jgi:zinc/manganese transport system substrate-binding protein